MSQHAQEQARRVSLSAFVDAKQREAVVELAERAGHSRPSMSLDVYSHVMPADEIASDRFVALIDEAEVNC